MVNTSKKKKEKKKGFIVPHVTQFYENMSQTRTDHSISDIVVSSEVNEMKFGQLYIFLYSYFIALALLHISQSQSLHWVGCFLITCV